MSDTTSQTPTPRTDAQVLSHEAARDLSIVGTHFARQLERENAALTAQVALLREGIERTLADNLHLADGEDCTLATLKATLALAATPESAGKELAELRKERDALAAWKQSALTVESWWKKIDDFIRKQPDAPLGKSVADIALTFLQERANYKESTAKYATEVQQLADIIIGGENVPAPFAEVLARAEELREDPARLEFLMAGGEVKVRQAGRNYSVVLALHYRVNRADVDAAMHTQSRMPERLKGDPIVAAESKRGELAKWQELHKDKRRLDWLDGRPIEIKIVGAFRDKVIDVKASSIREQIDAAMQQEAKP